MTIKELDSLVNSEREMVRANLIELDSDAVVQICMGLAFEGCYGHHERGQRLWAFFRALQLEGVC